MMRSSGSYKLSIVLPCFNEAQNITGICKEIVQVIDEQKLRYELIVCDDGSSDDTANVVTKLAADNSCIKLLKLSRNFGKEHALTAGIAHATGQIIITMDGDGQHPPEKISEFLKKWQAGAQVVIGVRTSNQKEGLVKRHGSSLFYWIFGRLTGNSLTPRATDYCLITDSVQQEFVKFAEPQRITRGLIDWLGFKKDYVYFSARPRQHGQAGYTLKKLIGLAANSIIAYSPAPLYFFGYVGSVITTCSLLLGTSVFIEQILMHDPLGWKFTGTAMLSILLLFVAGIILASQGILALYVSQVHRQTKGRPLYVVDKTSSIGFSDE